MRKIYGLITAFLFLLVSAATAYSQTYLAARLSQAQQFQSGSKTDSVDKGYTGTAIFILSPDSSSSSGNLTLRYMVTVGRGKAASDTSHSTTPGGGTTSPILKAIYLGIGAIGDTGTVLISITSGFNGNSYTGTLSSGGNQIINSAFAEAIATGRMFITAVLDSGKIRGQIYPVTGSGFAAHLTAPQEAENPVSKASGVGSFLLTDLGLIYEVSVQGIDIVASHIHMGLPGISGNIIKPITFSGHTAIGIWTPTDNVPFTKELRTALLTEDLYVNVHSTQYPAGEIRGQILHASGLGFSSPLRSSKADTSGGKTGNMSGSMKRIIGIGTYTLTDFGLVYHINLRGKITVNNIYFADNSTNQKLKDIPKFNDTTYSGVWSSRSTDDPNPLVDGKVADLLMGKVSLVVEASTDTVKSVITLHKQTNFSAILSGPQERPGHMVHPTGAGHFVLTPNGLSYFITITGIDTIVGSHFHFGEMGISGPIVHAIHFDSSFIAQGVWNLKADSASGLTTQDMTEALLEGKIYVNVHTPSYPAGEIRGQLLPASGTDFKAMLTGSQEAPSTTEKMVGTGNFILTNEGLVYKITVDSLNIVGSHFHKAPMGVSGGIVKDITASFDSSHTAVGVWRRTGPQALTDSLLFALMTGEIYVNVHTSQNPAGAIRGQLLPNGGTGFIAIFDSATAGPYQTPPAEFGSGLFVLTDAGVKYDISVAGFTENSGSITNGQGGTSVFQLTPNFSGGSSKGVWMMLNDTTNAANNIAALFNNALYVDLAGVQSAPIRRTFTPAPTSVKLLKTSPESFALEQNYPNPFNPATTIRFSIPATGSVSLHIYNIIGQKVATLVDGQLKAGRYEVSFDGSKVASGVYFYRIIFQNNIVTKKMMLVK